MSFIRSSPSSFDRCILRHHPERAIRLVVIVALTSPTAGMPARGQSSAQPANLSGHAQPAAPPEDNNKLATVAGAECVCVYVYESS